MYYGILFSGQGAQRSGMGVELMADSFFQGLLARQALFVNLICSKL